MSDTRHQPPVSSPLPGDDAEEAPTSVIGRITGEWPPPESGHREAQDGRRGTGTESAESGLPSTSGTTGPGTPDGEASMGAFGRRPDSARPDSPRSTGATPSGGAFAGGRDPYGLPDGTLGTGALGAADSPSGLPSRRPGAQGPSAQSLSTRGLGATTGPAGTPATSDDRPPLPVRHPRKTGAARLGEAPEMTPAPGFDYFGSTASDGRGASGRPGEPGEPAVRDSSWHDLPGPAPDPLGQRNGRALRRRAEVMNGSADGLPAATPPPAERAAFQATEDPGAQRTKDPGAQAAEWPQGPDAVRGRWDAWQRRAPGEDPEVPEVPGAVDLAAHPAPATPADLGVPAVAGAADGARNLDEGFDRPAGRPAEDLADDPAEQPIALPAWASAAALARAEADPFGRLVPAQEGADAPDGWEQPDEEPAPKAKRPRDPFLDNVKFLLIALVPAGHSLVPTLAADSSRAAYLYIYVFHMPLFVMISGYLSRNFWNSNAKTNKLVDTFLVPYVIVEIGYAALRTALGHKFSITITDPAWLNWYLLALLFWRLSTPVWKRMKYPAVIAVIVYLFAGFSELTGDFSMDRFFGLMPFFVIGLVIKPELFEFLKKRWVMALSALVLIGGAAVSIYLVKNYSIKLGPIYYKDSYKQLHLVWWKGLGLRTALLIAALTMSMAVMSLVPKRQTWFTDLGTRTLYCYLLHGVPVLIAKEMGWLSAPWLYGPLGVAAIMSACFALAIVLCLPVTRTAFKWLLEPRLTWLYRRPSQPAKQPA